MSAMQWQADHGACLELVQSSPVPRRHNRVLQVLAVVISMAKVQRKHPEADAVIFTTKGGAKSWHGRAVKSTNQRKCLLDGCDDWEVSADVPEWDSYSQYNQRDTIKA